MKQRELQERATCCLCKRKLLEKPTPSVTFFVIQLSQYLLNLPAIQRAAGLEMILDGNAALAHAMGPDEDLAKQWNETVTVTVCYHCAMEPGNTLIYQLIEAGKPEGKPS